MPAEVENPPWVFLIYRVELKVAMYIFSQKSKKQVSDFVKRGGLYKYEGGIKGC